MGRGAMRLAVAILIVLGPFVVRAEEVSPEVAAWQAFCDAVEQAGVEILNRYPQPHEIDRAEAPLFLAQQLGVAIEETLTRRDAAFPLLRLGASTINKSGLDSADAKYFGASIQGDATYRLRGTLGDARLIALQAIAKGPPFQAFGRLSGADLAPDDAGEFEVMLAPERPEGWEGAWIETGAQATDLLIREYFGDWSTERPSEMTLQRVEPVGPPVPMTMAESQRLLEGMAAAFSGRAPIWQPRVQQVRERLRNQLTPAQAAGEQGLADNLYGTGWFALEAGEAMLIELDAPDALHWSFQLGNFWWESLDYVNRTGSLNGEQAVPSPDGRYRILIAATDPGVPNWLDTGGHPEGFILYRFQQTRDNPRPNVHVGPIEEIVAALPAGTLHVSPQARRAEIAERQAHGARRWAP